MASADNRNHTQLIKSVKKLDFCIAKAFLLYVAPDENDQRFLDHLASEVTKYNGGTPLPMSTILGRWNKKIKPKVDQFFARLDERYPRNERPVVVRRFTVNGCWMNGGDDGRIAKAYRESTQKGCRLLAFLELSKMFKKMNRRFRPFDLYKYWEDRIRAENKVIMVKLKRKPRQTSWIKKDFKLRYKLNHPTSRKILERMYAPNRLPKQLFKNARFFLLITEQDWLAQTELSRLDYLIKIHGGTIFMEESEIKECTFPVTVIMVGENVQVAEAFSTEMSTPIYNTAIIYKSIRKSSYQTDNDQLKAPYLVNFN